MSLFQDRSQAGSELVKHLTQYAQDPNVIVIGLPRGGLPVAAQVATALGLPLDIVVTRKIGAPFQPELALGALTQEGTLIITNQLAHDPRIKKLLPPIIKKEQQELKRRLHTYRGNKPPLDLTGKTALIIDDGIATGATVRAAIESVRALGAHKIIVATPVAPPEILPLLSSVADDVLCLATPSVFGAVGQFYLQFPQVSDEEVIRLLHTKNVLS